jgi:hypothetical protein
MTKIVTRSRVAVALGSLFLALTASVAIATPLPVDTADIGGGVTYNPGATPPNATTKDGTATGGSVAQNADGKTADANMFYTTPNDGSTYTGTYTVISYDENGTQIAQATSGVTDYGNGAQMVVGYGAITLPRGGMILIRLTESNGRGGSFTAAFRLRNFQP